MNQLSQILAPPVSRADLEAYANRLRQQLGIEDVLRIPVLSLIEERIGLLLDSSFNYEYVDISQLPNEYAHYSPKENLLTIREDVYMRASTGVGRDRFTLAHEIGHYCLHSDNMVLSRAEPGQIIPTYRNPEWQANTFASYFMMPRRLIVGMTAEEVSKYCGTSLQAAQIALKR